MKLDDSTFIVYAMQHYDNPHCHSVEEFEHDLKRIQYIKRLLGRYHTKKELRERLILNHMVVLYNCFGSAATEMLMMSMEKYHSYLKPFIEFLNFMPKTLVVYSEKAVDINKIESDKFIVERLKQI